MCLFFLGETLLTLSKDIKTYAVTPLNEECGLIEWVDNLRTLREIVMKLLRERGITLNVNSHELRESL
jgi:serine/threonine-protein kinase ATR